MLVIKVSKILGPYKSPPHSRNYSVNSFLRHIPSKTGITEPRQTEFFHSNYCVKKHLVLQQCSGWCRRMLSHSGLWVLDLGRRSGQALVLVCSAKDRTFQPQFCYCRIPSCKEMLFLSRRLTSSAAVFLESPAVLNEAHWRCWEVFCFSCMDFEVSAPNPLNYFCLMVFSPRCCEFPGAFWFGQMCTCSLE